MPSCPECRKVHPIECGLRLFNSTNECPICMEKSSTMLALPCGHQYCQGCLGKIGMKLKVEHSAAASSVPRNSATANSVPRLPIRQVIDLTRSRSSSSAISSIQRHIQNRLHQVRRPPVVRRRRVQRRVHRTRRRCGWCGHIGHTQRKCKKHRERCGCTRLDGASHKAKYRAQHKCIICFKRGHRWRTCSVVVKGS